MTLRDKKLTFRDKKFFIGTIDCRELVIGLSAILEGEDSFAKFVFDMFDEDGSGVLQPEEVENFSRVCLSNFHFNQIDFNIIVTFTLLWIPPKSDVISCFLNLINQLINEHGEW